ALVVFPRVEALRELLQHTERKRIQDRGAVQRDGGDAFGDLDDELPQSFFHAGLRFSRNAFTPSAWSAWSKRSMKRSRSRARPAGRGMPLRALWMSPLQYSTARGESLATRSASAVAAATPLPLST